MKNTPPVVSVVGKSNVGKTTFIEKLVREMKRRHYKVATIKRDVHGFDVDRPGKDSWRHGQAGSDCVVISSHEKLAMIQKLDDELPIDEVVSRLPEMDIVLTEGYKRQNKPKIEVSRREMGSDLLCNEEELICIATDQVHDMGVPQFDLDDAAGVVNLLENLYLRRD